MKKLLVVCCMFLFLCSCNSKNNTNNQSIVAYRELTNNGYENVYDFGAMSKCDNK